LPNLWRSRRISAAIGAATGAIIGNQSGHSLEGAPLVALLGGIAGLVCSRIYKHKRQNLLKKQPNNIIFNLLKEKD
jgi:uncharacterized protein YcfJ